MPQGSSSIKNGCKNSDFKSPETSTKLSCKEQSPEFKAEIIPYNREDPNEPILAFSGGNINLIFSIPKESFKKLAVAAIRHLEQESDIKLQEKSFCNSCKEKSEMSIKSNIQDINVDNSNYVVTSENESCKSKGRNIDNLDAKSCKDSHLSMNKADYHDSESSVASQFTDEAKSTNEDIETAPSREVLSDSDFSDNFLNQHTVQHSPTDEKFDNHSKATGTIQENSVQMPNISEEIIADECEEILNQASEIVEESKLSSEESVVEKSIKRENFASEISLYDKSDSLQVEKIQKVSKEASKSPENESYVERSEECIDLVADELKLSGNSFASNLDSFMDTTVETLAESMSEGDFESDDVKSVFSESDDSKEEKKISKRKDLKKQFEIDEVDCVATRVRTRKVIGSLMKDVIPENTELKNAKTSNSQSSTLDVSSKNSVKKSPVGRCLRRKSLDPSPHPGKGVNRKHASVVESKEINHRVRSNTPDIVSKKYLKVTMRSSPRNLAKSSANTESNTTSKAQRAKTNVADKSQTNLESSMLSSKRNKRGSRD